MNPVAFAKSGALCVYPSHPQVTAVFPTLSSTVQQHAQEIRLTRGDAFDIECSTQDDQDPPSGVTVSGSIARFAVKQGFGDLPSNGPLGNSGALIIKRSYDPTQIEFNSLANGRFTVHLTRVDTYPLPLVPTVWGIELTIPGSPVAAGFASTLPGDKTVMVSGVDLVASQIVAGDIVHLNGLDVLVVDVLSASAFLSDFGDWPSLRDKPFTIYTGQTRLVASGPWVTKGSPLA